MAAMKALLLASACSLVAGRFLAPPSAAKGATPKEATISPHNGSAAEAALHNTTALLHKNSIANMTHENATLLVNKKHELTEEEQLSHLQDGLETIQKLQSVFTSGAVQTELSASEMASGAMTSELSKKDSTVWSTIAAMMEASKKVATKMTGASKADRAKIMSSLEDELNNKADQLKKISDKASEVNAKHSAEYLLGLLMSHRKDWSIEQQLNTTRKFANSSMEAWDLAMRHNMSQDFASQLATIMDNHKKALANATAKAKNATAKANHQVAKGNATSKTFVAAKKAVKEFIQLVDSLRSMRA